jgi:hypothetical protein
MEEEEKEEQALQQREQVLLQEGAALDEAYRQELARIQLMVAGVS